MLFRGSVQSGCLEGETKPRGERRSAVPQSVENKSQTYRLVKQQDPRLADQSSRDRDALLLPSTQTRLSHRRVKPSLQIPHKPAPSRISGLLDLRSSRGPLRHAVGDVVVDRAGEDDAFLRDVADRVSVRAQVEVGDFCEDEGTYSARAQGRKSWPREDGRTSPVERDGSRIRLVESEDEVLDRRFSRSGSSTATRKGDQASALRELEFEKDR